MATLQRHAMSDEDMQLATRIIELVNQRPFKTKGVNKVYLDYEYGNVVFETEAGTTLMRVDDFIEQCIRDSD